MDKKTYPEILTKHLPAIKREWVRVTGEILGDTEKAFDAELPLVPVIESYLAKPGKFVRPSLFLFGYSLSGKKIDSKIVRFALSLELLHTYLLVHDDIMDQSDLRRGVKSLHKLFEDYHEKAGLKGSSENFGVSMAILFGDILASKADEIWTVAENGGLIEPSTRILFEKMKREVNYGQLVDIMVSEEKKFPEKRMRIE